MAIERARVQAFPRPWGVVDLTPWSNAGHDGVPIGEIWYERPAQADSKSFAPAQAAVHERATFHPGPSGRCLCAVDGAAERQDRGLVRPQCGSWSQGRPRPEAAADPTAIARTRWTTARSRILSCGRPCLPDDVIFVPSRYDSRDRRGARHCRDPAAQRRNVPAVRSRSPA